MLIQGLFSGKIYIGFMLTCFYVRRQGGRSERWVDVVFDDKSFVTDMTPKIYKCLGLASASAPVFQKKPIRRNKGVKRSPKRVFLHSRY